MARALETVEQATVLTDHPLLTGTYGRYSYRIERIGDQSTYSVTDGMTTVTMPIRWALGASSAMGQTYILEKDGELYESRMSWYRTLNGLGPTLGGGSTLPANVQEAAGRLMSRDDKLRCFGCHATNAAQGTHLTLEKMVPGVQCGHCHEGAEAHLAAMSVDSGKPAVQPGFSGLRKLSAEQASNFCGQCHRTWAEVAMQGIFSISNVRFQPYRLTGSRCYDPDDARISCLACHNPHREASAQPMDYDAKCDTRHVPLNTVARSAFRQLREDSAGTGRVFIEERGLPLKKPRYWWEAAVEEAKLEDFHWHYLRLCFASSLVMAGVDLRTAAQLLGHRTLQMVMRYSHLSQSHELAAVERLCKTDEGSEKQSGTRSDTSHRKSIRKVE
jgi:hypothetical protein